MIDRGLNIRLHKNPSVFDITKQLTYMFFFMSGIACHLPAVLPQSAFGSHRHY